MLMAAVDRRIELERLVRTHQRGVWRYLRYLGADNAEADDITQETFLTVWRNPFDQYDERATAGYLRQVAKNKFLMHVRAKGRRPEVGNLDQATELFADFARDDGGDRQIVALTECMQRLQGKAKQVVDVYYKEGSSRAAAATIMQMTEEGVKTLLRRVKAKLRECVEGKLR
jgi:RNA polymerase sigma-70 factor (ECF subfamily)